MLRDNVISRRSIGAYYTPRELADVLSQWAIRTPYDRVLEPSFGGCEFLTSLAVRLTELGSPNPAANLIGFDIDPYAFATLKKAKIIDEEAGRFFQQDFLGSSLKDTGEPPVDVVIGNPPYVRHHAMTSAQQDYARRIRTTILPTMSLQASMWAVFVLHACEFLIPGGRAAWVLPQAFLHATYAQPLRDFLVEHFDEVHAFRIAEPLFRSEGAEESTVVVLAEGWRIGRSAAVDLKIYEVRDVHSLQMATTCDRLASFQAPQNPDATAAILARRGVPLSHFFDIRIGVVLGDAKFFLFNKNRADAEGLTEKDLTPIFAKSSMFSGIDLHEDDLRCAFERGSSSMVLDTRTSTSQELAGYLRRMPTSRMEANATFKKRPLWHQPFDDFKADCFFTGMSHIAPRIILNQDLLPCTNSLYRLRLKQEFNRDVQMYLAVALTSTLGQLSAEVTGRAYAGGLLKHEPRDLRRLQLPLIAAPTSMTQNVFARVDQLLRAGRADDATQIADAYLEEQRVISYEELTALAAELRRLRGRRIKSTKSNKLKR